MEAKRRWILLQLLRMADLFVMAACYFLAASAVSYTIKELSFEEFLNLRIKLKNFLLFPLIMMMWTAAFSSLRLYDSRRLTTWREDAADILKATVLGTAGVILSGIVFRISLVTPTFIAVFLSSSFVVTVLFRVSLKFLLWKSRLLGRNLRFVVLVGTNSRALRTAREIEATAHLGYRILGFADDAWEGTEEFRNLGYPLVSDLAGLPDYLRTHVVDEVLICLPLKTLYEEAAHIVGMCENQGITIRFLSDFFNRRTASPSSVPLRNQTLITYYPSTMNSWPALAKRGIDILVSLALLLVLSPLILLVTVLIRIDSRGPVFFSQERIGINKRKFRVHKFRTMVEGAERMQAELEHMNEADGAAFKIRNDPRVTSIGRFLRKTSLDELPQLYNVLKGEMSLVGPRPLPVRDFEAFYRDWHRRRFSIRPGITCLWQVNGRSNLTFESWMEMDLQYIDHWSLWLDLKILFKTIPAVLKGTGAA